jgi:hypothetical protein
MRTVIDIIKALEGFPHTTPVQIGLVGSDGGRVVHDIHAIEAHESGVVLLVESHASAKASVEPEERTAEADQTGEAIAAPVPPAAPGGLEGEGEEPKPPRSETGRPGDRV